MTITLSSMTLRTTRRTSTRRGTGADLAASCLPASAGSRPARTCQTRRDRTTTKRASPTAAVVPGRGREVVRCSVIATLVVILGAVVAALAVVVAAAARAGAMTARARRQRRLAGRPHRGGSGCRDGRRDLDAP